MFHISSRKKTSKKFMKNVAFNYNTPISKYEPLEKSMNVCINIHVIPLETCLYALVYAPDFHWKPSFLFILDLILPPLFNMQNFYNAMIKENKQMAKDLS